jgi:glycosyltransferase involved in cell wall biosynthesis
MDVKMLLTKPVKSQLISIVVPSVRSHTISETIDSIIRQTDPDWNLVISDQSGNDSLQEIVDKIGDPRVKRVKCPGRGASMARNFGIANTTGELIAFTDDDCKPREDWIATIRAIFADHPDLWMVTGSIVPPPVLPTGPHVCPSYVPDELIGHASNLNERIFSVTANAAYRRTAFQKAGPFDICFSPGTEFCGGEEDDHGRRMEMFDAELMRTPKLEVEHTYGVRVGAKAAWQIKRNYAVSVGGLAGKEELLTGVGKQMLTAYRRSALTPKLNPGEIVRGVIRYRYILDGYRRAMNGYDVDRTLRLMVPRGKTIAELYAAIPSSLEYQLPPG